MRRPLRSFSFNRFRSAFLALILVASVGVSILQATTTYADTPTFGTMNVDQQVRSYIYYYAVASCIEGKTSIPNDWVARSVFDDGSNKQIGYYIAPDDGVQECRTLVPAALSLWGYADLGAALTDWGYVLQNGEWKNNRPAPSFLDNIDNRVYGGKHRSPDLSVIDKYLLYSQTLFNACQLSNPTPLATANAGIKDAVTKRRSGYVALDTLTGTAPNQTMVPTAYTVGREGSYSLLANGTIDGAGFQDCYGLATQANKYSGFYLTAANKDPGSVPAPVATGAVNPGEDKTSCGIDKIGWIVCPVIDFLAGLNDAAFGFLQSFLVVPSQVFKEDAAKNAWEAFRNIANIMFVIAFMIIIYSQITGAGVSNYGVKRLLPKLIIAAILVNVSFYLCAIAVDISNILGASMYDLLGSRIDIGAVGQPVGTAGSVWQGIAVGVLYVGAGIGLLALIIFAPASLLAFALVILILIARQVFVILLVVISPIAFVAYLLPNTEQWFKKWSKAFIAVLMVFPIIGLVFGASTLASDILLSISQTPDDTGDTKTIMKIISAAVLAIPLFAVPVILKGSLSAAGSIGGKIAGLQDRATRRAGKDLKETRQDMGNRWKTAAFNSNSRIGRNLGGITRFKTRRDALRSSRDTEAKRGAQSYFAEALNEKDEFGNYTESARRLQNSAAGGSVLNQADDTAKIRMAAMATRGEHKQFDEDVSAFKTTMSNKSNEQLVSMVGDMSLSTEQRAAAAGMVMSRSHRESHLAALSTIRQQMEDAQERGDDSTIKELSSVQMQMAHDMKDKPFGLGDQSIGQLVDGTYGKKHTITDEAGNTKEVRAADIFQELRTRTGTKLSAQSLATLNPDEMRHVYNDAMSGNLTPAQMGNLVNQIGEIRKNKQMEALVKPEAKALHDEILARQAAMRTEQDAAAATYGPGI